MPPEIKAALDAERPHDTVEVWPDMKDAVALFFALSTQWRWVGAGMAGAMRTGLDYSPMPGVAAALSITVSADVLSDLRTMESAAVEKWGEK